MTPETTIVVEDDLIPSLLDNNRVLEANRPLPLVSVEPALQILSSGKAETSKQPSTSGSITPENQPVFVPKRKRLTTRTRDQIDDLHLQVLGKENRKRAGN